MVQVPANESAIVASQVNSLESIRSLAQTRQLSCPLKKDLACPDNVRATKVLQYLFLGNAADAADSNFHEENNISYVLNLTCDCPNYFCQNPNYHYKQVKIEDNSKGNICEIASESVQFIGK